MLTAELSAVGAWSLEGEAEGPAVSVEAILHGPTTGPGTIGKVWP